MRFEMSLEEEWHQFLGPPFERDVDDAGVRGRIGIDLCYERAGLLRDSGESGCGVDHSGRADHEKHVA